MTPYHTIHMATHTFVTRPTNITFKSYTKPSPFQNTTRTTVFTGSRPKSLQVYVYALNDRSNSSSNYVVPLDYASTGNTRPLAEIFPDLNKRIPNNIIVNRAGAGAAAADADDNKPSFIPWYHANRMLSFYAPGWCGEIRDVIFSDSGSVTVVYRVTVRGSDGEAHREATGTVLAAASDQSIDPVAIGEA